MEHLCPRSMARWFLVLVLTLGFGLMIQSPLPLQAGGNGQIEISVWSKGTWRTAGALSFDHMLTQQQIDLASFALSNPVQVRITHIGATAAHIDAATFGGNAPIATQGASESSALVAKKLAQRDYDVIDASSKSLVFAFPTNDVSSVFSLVARIEPEKNPGAPFQYPTSNIPGAVDSNSQFYAYRLNSVAGTLNINGDLNEEKLGEPFFKEWSQPITGHPANFTYGWVRNDADDLYVAIEFLSDNTFDGEKDFTTVFVKTANGVRRFEVSVPHPEWGVPGFEYTDRAVYQHKVYEFKIPLAQIGLNAASKDTVELVFEAYGTSAGPTPTTTFVSTSPNPSIYGQSVSIQMSVRISSSGTPVTTGGTVTVMEGITVICPAQAINSFGNATCDTSALAVGNHTLTASFTSASSSYAPSSKNTTHTVNTIPTTTTLTGPSGNFTGAQAFTFTATVTETAGTAPVKASAPRAPAQTGTVSFYDNGVLIPTCTNVPLVGGVATCSVTLGVGVHVISAVYSGDANNAPSTSTTTLTLTIAQQVTVTGGPGSAPKEVTEGDTLLLLGGGLGGLGVWLRYQWSKRRKVSG